MTAPIAHQPNKFSVEFFQPDRFAGPYGWTSDRDGNINPVLHARFIDGSGTIDGFAKPFSTQDVFQATQTLNEVTGWLIAKGSGLPVADRAFFSVIHTSELPPYSGQLPLPAPDADGNLLCFTTQAVGNTAIRGRYNTDSLVKEQSSWPLCDATIAFDEGLANTDRHPFNLLRRGADDFVLIDHGMLLRDILLPYPFHWDENAFDGLAARPFANALHNFTYNYLGRSSKAVTQKGLDSGLLFSQKLASALPKILFELAFWCSKLMPGKSADWLLFLRNRLMQHNMQQLLHGRYGLLTLHA